MTVLTAGALIMASGSMLNLGALRLLRRGSAIERDRATLGNTDSVVVRTIPADMAALLSQLD